MKRRLSRSSRPSKPEPSAFQRQARRTLIVFYGWLATLTVVLLALVSYADGAVDRVNDGLGSEVIQEMVRERESTALIVAAAEQARFDLSSAIDMSETRFMLLDSLQRRPIRSPELQAPQPLPSASARELEALSLRVRRLEETVGELRRQVERVGQSSPRPGTPDTTRGRRRN